MMCYDTRWITRRQSWLLQHLNAISTNYHFFLLHSWRWYRAGIRIPTTHGEFGLLPVTKGRIQGSRGCLVRGWCCPPQKMRVNKKDLLQVLNYNHLNGRRVRSWFFRQLVTSVISLPALDKVMDLFMACWSVWDCLHYILRPRNQYEMFRPGFLSSDNLRKLQELNHRTVTCRSGGTNERNRETIFKGRIE